VTSAQNDWFGRELLEEEVWEILGGGGDVKGDRRVVGYRDLGGAIVVVVRDICVFHMALWVNRNAQRYTLSFLSYVLGISYWYCREPEVSYYLC
jgi:hypothetical protein